MKLTTRSMIVLSLGLLGLTAGESFAGWNNVFQTTSCCNNNSSRSSYFVAPPPSTCCPPSVSYVQRSYYQPVTTYKTETYMEPVTSYRTSYYWEPVTKYKYTSYYDPCTGCSQNVATPTTSYYLRSKCNAVQSYVQRCRMVPVTEMRKSYYLEPVVTYSNPCGDTVPVGEPPISGGVQERGNAGIQESGEPPRIPKTELPNTSFQKTTPVNKPYRPDRVASFSDKGRLQGNVVAEDRISPRPNATLIFVDGQKREIVAKSDYTGRFAITLAAGDYTMYVPDRDGKPVFHSQLFVKNTDDRNVTVVSR